METIIVAMISGVFSLAAIWYHNHLQQKSVNKKVDGSQVNEQGTKGTTPLNMKKLRIGITIIIVVFPLLLLLLLGKERLAGNGGKFLMVYYFIWVIVTSLALVIGWKTKTLFEKIILFVSLIFLVLMTFVSMFDPF